MIFNYASTMPGALTLTGQAGSLAAILKAYLVTGVGLGSITSLTVAAEIATANYSAGHPFIAGTVALVAGATPSGLNGKKLVLSTGPNTITFAAPGVADGTAAGTITSKLAPAGWEELFTGTTDVLAIKPTAVEATGHILRIDDTGTTNARVRAYESMTDINTGAGLSPTDVQCSGGLYWGKSATANAAAREWRIVADDRAFYFMVAPNSAGRFTVLFSGDADSLKSGDAYGYLVDGNQSDETSISSPPTGCLGASTRFDRAGAYFVRAYSGIGGSTPAQRMGAHHTGLEGEAYAGTSGYAHGIPAFPNAANNGVLAGKLELIASGLRGTLPGLLHVLGAVGSAFVTGEIILGTDDLAGRRLMVVRSAPPSGGAYGCVLVDLTGPWRD